MENKHRKITVCRELNEAEIKAINAIKEIEGAVSVLIYEMESSPELDQSWVEKAKESLQTGFMFAVRSVDKQTTF